MLKKLFAALVLTLVAGNAFAGASNEVYSTSPFLNLQGFNLSKNVSVSYATTDNSTYSAASKHLQGDKCYGGTSASSYIWFKDCTAGAALVADQGPDIPGSPSDSAVSNGFTKM